MKNCPQCQRTYADDMEFCPQDGTRLVASVTANEGQLAAGLSRRFRIVRRLGAGGMGTVYLAQQIGVGNRPVALKVLNRKLLDDPEFLQRFQDEAGSTGRIHHHNVVTIYEAAQADDGTPYIAMEFLDGETLRDALKERGGLPVEECAEILNQTAHGLNAAHKLGIIHRDLKPDNIFLTRGDGDELVVKVVDFGIAKLRESVTHTLTGMVLGTPAYMSSEQASGIRSDQLDLRSDVYSLGIVVYEMLTGALPFHSDTPLGYLRKHMLETPPPLRTVASGLPVPEPVEAIVMKALAKDRSQRFGSALEFSSEFSRAVRVSTPSEPLLTTRVVEPGAWEQPSQELKAPGMARAEHAEKRPEAADSLARPQAEQAGSTQDTAADPRPTREKPTTEPIAREVPKPPAARPVSVPSPTPIQPIPQPNPPPAIARPLIDEPGRKEAAAGPALVSHSTGSGRNKFFKVGFWILGISEALLIVEGLASSFRYIAYYGLVNWFSLIVGIGLGCAFIVINCRFLARRRYTGLLWLSLVFAVLGIIANNAFWIGLDAQMSYHMSYSSVSLLAMLRSFTTSAGPFSAVIGPFVMSFLGRGFYYAGVVNLDCLLRIGFLIWALRKYRDAPLPVAPSA